MFLISIYVMVYIMSANAIAVWSIYQLYMGGIGFGWASVSVLVFTLCRA